MSRAEALAMTPGERQAEIILYGELRGGVYDYKKHKWTTSPSIM
jgi:hypothetical protein